MLVVIDYGMGNLNSIVNMIKKVGGSARVSDEPEVIRKAEKLILPGVGAFDTGMKNLLRSGLKGVLEDQVLERSVPIMGICLGMQLLTRRSEEGEEPGLGWIDAETKRFDFGSNPTSLKIPHMGWNTVLPRSRSGLFADFDDTLRFYFVHSYYCECEKPDDIKATAVHGVEFTCAFGKGNIVGTQFHPEKSHRFGRTLLRNFLAFDPKLPGW